MTVKTYDYEARAYTTIEVPNWIISGADYKCWYDANVRLSPDEQFERDWEYSKRIEAERENTEYDDYDTQEE